MSDLPIAAWRLCNCAPPVLPKMPLKFKLRHYRIHSMLASVRKKHKLKSMRILLAFLVTVSVCSAEPLKRGIDWNLPQSVLERFESEKFLKSYDLCGDLNPFYLRGDFDGDGIPDYAILVTNRSTKQVGIAIVRSGAKKIELFGAGGINLQKGSVKDYVTMDVWGVERKHKLEPNHWDKPIGRMMGEGIEVAKSESWAALIYWDGKQYRWFQISD